MTHFHLKSWEACSKPVVHDRILVALALPSQLFASSTSVRTALPHPRQFELHFVTSCLVCQPRLPSCHSLYSTIGR
ncbi:unnamed protein product [Citrullus colocynthis]|uniref:Secreted protein n=1 Tax=Citrullus colocynthis TaxID=252529 RepID=A0ABP0XT51_9ROSI